MSKITLSNVADLTQVTTAQTTINSNSSTVQTAFDNTLSRDGTNPNTMGANLDMNSNQILNLPAPTNGNSPLRLADLSGFNSQTFTVNTLPTGGTTGQILRKNSSANYDTSWAQDLVYITDYGAIGDGNIVNASVNTTALNNALATGRPVYIPWTASGYHFGTNTITITTGQSIQGEGGVLLKSTVTGSNGFLRVTSSETLASPSYIDNISIDMTGAGGTSTAIIFGTSSAIVAGVQISRCLFTNCNQSIGQETSASNYVVDLKLYDLRFEKTLGRQIYLSRSRGFIWCDTLRIDNTQAGQTTPVTWEGARFEDFIGLEINRFDCVGPTTTTFQSGQTGLVINGTGQSGAPNASVWLNRILIDNTSGNGILINNVNYLNANWIESFQNLGNAIQIQNTNKSDISNVLINGGSGLTGAAAGGVGFQLNTCTFCNVTNIYSTLNTGAGISIFNTTDSILANMISTANTSTGLNESGTSNRNVFTGGVFSTNGANVSLVGANSTISNYVGSGVATPTFTANGAVATALTSLGPTGSHTTVQTWLTVLDNTGTARYIPCF